MKKEDNPILNLDLDYFFTLDSDGQTEIRKYTDDFIEKVARWIKSESKNFQQIIICLSPECCGSWEESKKVKDLILNVLVE